MDASTVPMFADKTGPIHARVYLDAKTLWLARMEWTEPQSAPRLRLQIDYFDYEIGRELSAEECARQFSYHPTGDERVTEK
jgi:hypothetical protein